MNYHKRESDGSSYRVLVFHNVIVSFWRIIKTQISTEVYQEPDLKYIITIFSSLSKDT